MTLTCLEAALKYADRGWSVFPLDGKRPYRGTHGHTDATTDHKQIRAWWRKWPKANVGIACSSVHGPVVIDIDGPRGMKELELLDLPETREATSGRKDRRHLYFDAPIDDIRVKRTIKVRPELDVLGDGGYVVAPPSIHPETGRQYKWITNRPRVPLPLDIIELVREKRGSEKEPAAPLPEMIGEGMRDELLTSLAGSMRRRGASEEAILAALREENETRCDPPMEDRQLKKIARSIAQKPTAVKLEHLTDLGNARRFIANHHEHVRHVAVWKRPWLIWEGTHWAPDETGEVERLSKGTVRLLYQEAAHTGDPDARESLLKHAGRSEQASRIRALMDLASTEPEITRTADSFDANPWLFNVENGTINLKTGELQPHDREDLITKIAPVEYDPEARAPLWKKFLLEIMDGDRELVVFLQRAIGYSLTGDTREQCLFFCHGQGSNGKSTFLETLREMMGDYAQQADFTTFLARKSDGPRNDLARMRGARLCTAVEAQGDRGFDETVLKQLTGSDTIVARRLYEEFFEFKPQHKLFLAANHKPMVKEQTEAFWRRIKMVPFTVTFAPEQRDKRLASKLREELPGILNWAIEGCRDWRREGLTAPRAVTSATRSYREENDTLGEFIAARCRFEEDTWTNTPDLYRAFSEWWMETRGARTAPLSMGWFGRMLGERTEIRAVKRNRIRGWKGIALNLEVE